MSKSLNGVSREVRPLDTSGIDLDVEFDIAHAAMKHTYFPDKNTINAEFAIPTIKKQMMRDSYQELRAQHNSKSWHDIEYLETDNAKFHKLLRTYKLSKFRVFVEDTREWVTYYFSDEHHMKGMFYDYEAALLMYTRFPTRDFMRRQSCSTLDPECVKCANYLALPVQSFLDYPEDDLRADFYEFWFKNIGDIHGLLICYTIDREFEFRYSEEIYKPKYFEINFDTEYFKHGISNRLVWEKYILDRRMNNRDEFYSLGLPVGNSAGELSCRYHNPTLYKYNSGDLKAYIPTPIVDDADKKPDKFYFEGSDFGSLARFDMRNFNDRNSWHKWIFNTWVEKMQQHPTGWYCCWISADVLESTGGQFGSYPGVADMANQLGTSLGMAPDSSGEDADTVYTMVSNLILGYQYVNISEAHPDRVITMM
jgi:hypothetical protein